MQKDLKDQATHKIHADSTRPDSLDGNVEEEDGNADVCYICLDGGGQLISPCRCPRYVHSTCLARWNLQSAGTSRETFCEFCNCQLPPWKEVLTPPTGCSAPAIMNVNFDGRTYSFEVKPGPEGYRAFTDSIKKAFSLPDDSELNITFTCDEPSSGTSPEQGAWSSTDYISSSNNQSNSSSMAASNRASGPAGALLTLQGPGAYDAAVHCAAISAARRSLTSSPAAGSGIAAGGSSSRAASIRHKVRSLSSFGRRLRNAITDLFLQ